MIYSMETYLDDDRLPVIEKTKICEEKVTLNNPELIFNFLNKYLRLGNRTEEYVYLICFDTKSHPLGLFEISHGTVNSAVLSPREIYMKALLCGAANIAICSLPGLIGMKEAKLIECCANINGRKLYAI